MFRLMVDLAPSEGSERSRRWRLLGLLFGMISWLTLSTPAVWSEQPSLRLNFMPSTTTIATFAVSEDGRLMLSVDDEYHVVLWNIERARAIREVDFPTQGVAWLSFVGPSLYAIKRIDGTMALYALETGRMLHELPADGQPIRFDDESYVIPNLAEGTLWWLRPDGASTKLRAQYVRYLPMDHSGNSVDGPYTMQPGYNYVFGSGGRAYALSTDRSELVSATVDGGVGVWNVRTGDLVGSTIADAPFTCVSLSEDGQYLAGVSELDRQASVDDLDPNTGTLRLNIITMLTVYRVKIEDDKVRLQKVARREIADLDLQTCTFAPDGARVLVEIDGVRTVLNAQTLALELALGNEINAARFRNSSTILAVDNNNKQLFAHTLGTNLRRPLFTLPTAQPFARAMFFPGSHEKLLVQTGSGELKVLTTYNTSLSDAVLNIKGERIRSLVWSPSGTHLAVLTEAEDDPKLQTMRLRLYHWEGTIFTDPWDLTTFHARPICQDNTVAFTPDGGILAFPAPGNLIVVYDIARRLQVRSLPAQKLDDIPCVKFAAGGEVLLHTRSISSVEAVRWRSGQLAWRLGKDYIPAKPYFDPHNGWTSPAPEYGLLGALESLGGQGSDLFWASTGRGIQVYDGRTGILRKDLPQIRGAFNDLAISGRQIVAAQDGTFLGFDLNEDLAYEFANATINQPLAQLSESVDVSSDGQLAAAVGTDGVLRLLDIRTREFLALVVRLEGEGWLAVLPTGEFDTNMIDRLASVSWVMPDDPQRPLPADTFVRDYYEPGLIGRRILCRGEDAEANLTGSCEVAFSSKRDLQSLNRVLPLVRIAAVSQGPTADVALVELQVESAVDDSQRNGRTSTGVYDVRLFRDGQLVGQWPRPGEKLSASEDLDAWRQTSRVAMPTGRDRATHVFPVRLAAKDAGKKVMFTAYAFNEDRVKSDTATDQSYMVPNSIASPTRPRAYVVAVGVNMYQTDRLKLNFAADDANAISAALARLEGYDVVPVKLISDYARKIDGKSAPVVDHATKQNIRAVLERLAGKERYERKRLSQTLGTAADKLERASPDDIVILAFSGHGYAEQGRFYILPSDSGTDPTSLSSMISSEELAAWLRDIDAGEMVMIIDACHSAAGVPPGFKPGPMGDRGLGQLAYDKGMRILAATQADDVAIESGALGNGLLTYALVTEGLKPGADRKFAADINHDGRVTIKEWLTFSEIRVPTLYLDVLKGTIPKARDSKPNLDLLKDTIRHAQTPTLFDFAKAKTDTIVVH